MEDARTLRLTETAIVPGEGQTFRNNRTEEPRLGDDIGVDNGPDRERPISCRRGDANETKRADNHSEKESQCTRTRSHDDSAGGGHGFS